MKTFPRRLRPQSVRCPRDGLRVSLELERKDELSHGAAPGCRPGGAPLQHGACSARQVTLSTGTPHGATILRVSCRDSLAERPEQTRAANTRFTPGDPR